MKLVVILFTAMLLLSSCATSSYPGSSVQQGGTLQVTLNQPVNVAAGSSYAYIKAPGQVVARNDIGTYELYCKFALPRPKDSPPTVIQPEVFLISNIYQRVGMAPMLENLQVASFGVGFGGGFGGAFGMNQGSKRNYELYMELHSTTQSQVKSLSCIRFTGPGMGQGRPTLPEARQVLAPLATIGPVI